MMNEKKHSTPQNVEYAVKIYLNGVHWDTSYTSDIQEAIEWKRYFSDKSKSIFDRINGGVLESYMNMHGETEDSVENVIVTAEIENSQS